MSRRAWLVAPVIALVTCGAFWLSAPRFIRAKADQFAASRNCSIHIENISVGWFSATLQNVQISYPNNIRISLNTTTIHLSSTLQPTNVLAEGGSISLVGDPDTVRSVFVKQPSSSTSTSSSNSLPFSVTRVALRWDQIHPEVQELSADNVSISRNQAGVSLDVGKAKIAANRGSASLEQSHFEFSRSANEGYKPAQINLGNVVLELARDPNSKIPSENSEPQADGATTSFRDKVARYVEQARSASLKYSPLLESLPPIATKSFSVRLHYGESSLMLGADSVGVRRFQNTTLLEATPTSQNSGAKMAITLKVPDSADDGVSLELKGGPIPLGLLIRDPSALHLTNIDQTTVDVDASMVLTSDVSSFSWRGSANVNGLAVDHKKLAPVPVHGINARLSGEADFALDGSLAVVRKGTAKVGETIVEASGRVERSKDHWAVQMKAAIPLASCQAMIDGIPKEIIPMLVGSKLAGTFSAQGAVTFDSRKPNAADVTLNMVNECKFLSVPPSVEISRFRQPITRKVYGPDGQRFDLTTGPGTASWVPYNAISPFMFAALQTTEDGRFYRHKGFDLEAIRNSIKENLKERKFKRGASTLSMQAAKNLFLDREKTLARKIQEAFLTTYLEQTLSKEQILELYLNNIEFGPNLYGIGPASQYYFRSHPSALSLGQALYISSILPNPKVQHFGAGGRVSPGWMSHLHRLMRLMAKINLISDVDMQDGLNELVVFGQPKPEKILGIEPERDETSSFDSHNF